MNRKNRLRICLILFTLCLFFVSSTAFAAAPGKVKDVKAYTNGNIIKLSWKKMSSATGYEVYSVNKTTGKQTLVKKTKANVLSIKNCKYNKVYTFTVRACNTKNEFGPFSAKVSVKPVSSRPETPKYFRIEHTGNNAAYFRWRPSSSVKGYIIEMYDKESKNWIVKKTVTSSKTYKVGIKNLPAGEQKFRICSYKMVNGAKVLSKASSTLSVKLSSKPEVLNTVRAPYYTAKTKYKTTCVNTDTKETITLKKGTKITVKSKTGTTVKGFLKSGAPIKIKRSALKYTGLDSSPKNDYSRSVKEQFVNFQQLKSPSKYLIWISESKIKVNIFSGSKGKWKLVKTFPCCIGKWDARTVSGVRSILKTEPYGQYGGPVVYFSPGDGSSAEPAGRAFHNQVNSMMSKAVSHGCIRMVLSDLYWLYNHCPVGTTVYIF